MQLYKLFSFCLTYISWYHRNVQNIKKIHARNNDNKNVISLNIHCTIKAQRLISSQCCPALQGSTHAQQTEYTDPSPDCAAGMCQDDHRSVCFLQMEIKLFLMLAKKDVFRQLVIQMFWGRGNFPSSSISGSG